MKKSKYVEFKISAKEDLSASVKKYVALANSPEIVLDLSHMNMLEAAKIMALTSAYHLGMFPDGKVKCKLSDSQRCNFINPFITKNLELV